MASVAVIGGGITGLTAAYQLRQRNVEVTLFEATARTGGSSVANVRVASWQNTAPMLYVRLLPFSRCLYAIWAWRSSGLMPATQSASATSSARGGSCPCQIRLIPSSSPRSCRCQPNCACYESLLSNQVIQRMRKAWQILLGVGWEPKC
jgi:2-polyprenyl-6-methoxyphenol hydroxylase-like FAD-dependent oxidoreductase